MEAEKEIQEEEPVASVKKAKNASKAWGVLQNDHAELFGDMLKHFRAGDKNYKATKAQFEDRVARALEQPVFPPRQTLTRWLERSEVGDAPKQKQGGKKAVLSAAHQVQVLQTINAIRDASLVVDWRVVRRHVLALMLINGIQRDDSKKKFPSKEGCKVWLIKTVHNCSPSHSTVAILERQRFFSSQGHQRRSQTKTGGG